MQLWPGERALALSSEPKGVAGGTPVGRDRSYPNPQPFSPISSTSSAHTPRGPEGQT